MSKFWSLVSMMYGSDGGFDPLLLGNAKNTNILAQIYFIDRIFDLKSYVVKTTGA